MRTARTILFCSILFSVDCLAQPQSTEDPRRQCSFAITASRFGNDDGLGVEFGTPSLFANRLSLRMKANTVWLGSYKAATNQWARYQSVGASLVYNVAMIERSMFYTELGTQVIFPDVKFSNESHVPAWYFLTGLDLFFKINSHVKFTYFFAGGVITSDAHAEKLEGNPHYANGFLFSNGLRVYF